MNSEENLKKLELLFDYAKSLGLEFDPDWSEEDEYNESHVFIAITERDERSRETFDRSCEPRVWGITDKGKALVES